MRRGAAIAMVLSGLLVLSGPSSAMAGPSAPESFAFAIGNHTLDGDADRVGARYGRFDLVVVDGEEASRAEIAAIRARGTTVLGYLSVGTIEKWRSWFPRLRQYRLSAWKDWKDEWFADTSSPAYRRGIADDIAPMLLDKGFDGLFLDNVDMVEAARRREQRAGMAKLVAMLDGLVESRGALLYAQNGYAGVVRGYPGQGVDPLAPLLDGWNREDVSFTWDFDRRRYQRVGERAIQRNLAELEHVGALVDVITATDYVNVENRSLEAECEAVANAASAGALAYVADIGLTLRAVGSNPPLCT